VVVAFYNKRGTAEQCIKEGKGAIKWTRLSCWMFAANAVRLQLHALAYNFGRLRAHAGDAGTNQGQVAIEPKGEGIGAKVVNHDRYVAFQMGRGRHPTANVPAGSAADCGATTAASRSGMRLRSPCIQLQPTAREACPNAKQNSQISRLEWPPVADVTVSAAAPARLLAGGRKTANIHLVRGLSGESRTRSVGDRT